MYSKNDYRYYLENQLMHSDDYLAHYGVKGMKWKQHKVGVKINEPWENGSKRSYIEFNKQSLGPNAPKGAYYSDKIGIITNKKKKTVSAFNTTNQKYFKDDEKYTKKKRGRLTSEYAEDGSTHTLDLSKKKKRKKNKVSSLRKKYGLYRETPKGQKLKGGGNIYVSHS